MRLYLIRHGESANNVIFSNTGNERGAFPDPELTDTGHSQAQLLANHLADPEGDPLEHPWLVKEGAQHLGFGLTHVYCSLMTRSILTAQYVAEACALPLAVHPEIFERWGIYEEIEDGTRVSLPGSDRRYFVERFPNLQLPDGMGDGGWYGRPFETDDIFVERTKQVALDFVDRHAGTDDRVAMVIHGDLIDQLINEFTGAGRHADNYDNHWVANWATHNTSVTRLDFVSGSRAVVYTNRINHLPHELVTW